MVHFLFISPASSVPCLAFVPSVPSVRPAESSIRRYSGRIIAIDSTGGSRSFFQPTLWNFVRLVIPQTADHLEIGSGWYACGLTGSFSPTHGVAAIVGVWYDCPVAVANAGGWCFDRVPPWRIDSFGPRIGRIKQLQSIDSFKR